MFQSATTLIRAGKELAEDLLGDPSDWLDPARDPGAEAVHPHRRPLRWQYDRRPGSVPPPPAHCLCPVRDSSPSRRSPDAGSPPSAVTADWDLRL